MSDDRFKQARKSLIDRNRERHKKSGDQDAEEYDEDEATQMVDLDRLQSGGPPPSPNQRQDSRGGGRNRGQQGRSGPDRGNQRGGAQRGGNQRGGDQRGSQRRSQRGGSPGGGNQPQSDAFGAEEFDPEEKTHMFEVPADDAGGGGGVQIGGGGSAPEEQTAPSRDALDHPGPGGGRRGGSPSGPPSGGSDQNQQVFSPGGGEESGYEGKTDFINIDDFASGATEFAPEQQSAGYEGSTQFVSIDALTSGDPAQQAQQAGGIENDQILHQTYQFGPESIQQGEVTLIFAQNALGKDVVLRQLWDGEPSQMPAQMRQRIGELDDLSHPNLVSLNGVFAAQTGLWAELQRPEGFRLTAVLEQHGAQDEENVLEWMTSVAEVLDTIHEHQLIYASLTPNAIWIQEDNTVFLEPFDVLSFEHRGDLGPFGPPELAQAQQGTQLQPATDVFSLAAVMTAALTGLPFDPMRLNNLENQKLADGLKGALKQNPEDRPQTATELVDSLKGSDGIPLNPEEWDIKIVAGVAIVLMLGFAGFMYWRQQSPPPQPPAESANATATEKASGGAAGEAGDKAGAAAATGQDLNAKGEPPKTEPPGDLMPDPRVQVHTSYRYNPPAEDTKTQDSDEISAEAEALRQSARESIQKATDLADSERTELYKSALADLTKAIRLQGKMTAKDKELLEELQSKDLVQEYQENIRDDVRKAIRAGDVGDARFRYRKWATIDPSANAGDFFERVSSPQVRFISKIEDDEGDD
jgi:serine/threonine protein kinase